MRSTNFDVEMQFASSDGYVSVKNDVRRYQIVARWGITANGPTERIAGTGTVTLTLDNSQSNSAGTMGYYAPDSTDCRSGFGIGTPIRIKMSDTDAADAYKLYYVSDISPAPGKNLSRATAITGVDYMGRMATQYADALPVATTSRVDEGLSILYSIMPVEPLTTESSTGIDTLDYIFFDIDGRKMTILNVAQRLVQTDLGYLFPDSNATNGESMVYQTRQDRLSTTSCVTLDETMSGMVVNHAEQSIYNSITTIAPSLDIGSSETTDAEVIYSLQREIALAAGCSDTYAFRFRDPNAQGNLIHLYPGSGITPTSDTYSVTNASGTTGDELTTDVTVTPTWYADHASVKIVNGAAAAGYMHRLDLMGRAIRLYDPIENKSEQSSDSLALYGKRPLRFQLPYLDNPNTARDFGDSMLARWGVPRTQVESVEFFANRDDTLYAAAVSCSIGSRITLVESATGINGDYNINGVEWTIEPSGVWRCKWFLEDAETASLWALGVTSLSELGVSTYLGF